MLQAELDRDNVRRSLANEEREKFLMKDVPGWEVGSIYHADKYVDPNSHTQYARRKLMAGVVRRFIKPTYVVTPLHATKPEKR